MTTITSQMPAREANDLTFVTASDGGDDFVSTGREVLIVQSSHGDAVTMTVPVRQVVDGEPVDDKTIAIAAGATAVLGPWPTSIYGDAANQNKVAFDFGVDFADVQVAVVLQI